MDKDTREHYAALVGRLRKGDGSYRDADEAADAIEDLVAKLDAGRTPIKVCWGLWCLDRGSEDR